MSKAHSIKMKRVYACEKLARDFAYCKLPENFRQKEKLFVKRWQLAFAIILESNHET